MNDRGMPVIHNVAKILGCIRGAQDDVWAWAEKQSVISELRSKLSQQGRIEDEQRALSWDHGLSLDCKGFSSPSQDLNTPSTSAEAAMANPVQQKDWSLSQNHSSPKYQELQQKPDIILSNVLAQETRDDISNSPFFPMDSPLDQFPKPKIDTFDTRGSTEPFASDASMEVLDWAFWSDVTAWKVFQDPQKQWPSLGSDVLKSRDLEIG